MDDWLQLVNFVETLRPKIIYFSNDVFNFPNRIYVSLGEAKKGETQEQINKFYCEVVQDILYAIDPSLNLETHIVARKKSAAQADKQALAGLLQKMGRHVTQTIMTQWGKIFNRPLREKKVQAICDIEKNGQIYMQFRLEDGGELFDIDERSTGFRWFFVFILLTQYRGYRNESAIFLYDEPASNLHSAAQHQLITCFANLPDQFTVFYSTHSHYLINPDWLDSTMVVKNEAINLDDFIDFDSAKTDIKLLPYRQFVAQNPSGISYFQPILDVLQYIPSRLENVKPPLLVEGKGDFYALSYFAKVCCKLQLEFDIVPCLGSGTIDQLIALYAGWGKEFVVLLDSDKAGRSEKQRYEKKFGSLVNGRVICYEDINPAWEKRNLEKILGKAGLLEIQQTAFPGTSYKKELVHLAIQELNSRSLSVQLSPELKSNIEEVVGHLNILFCLV